MYHITEDVNNIADGYTLDIKISVPLKLVGSIEKLNIKGDIKKLDLSELDCKEIIIHDNVNVTLPSNVESIKYKFYLNGFYLDEMLVEYPKLKEFSFLIGMYFKMDEDTCYDNIESLIIGGSLADEDPKFIDLIFNKFPNLKLLDIRNIKGVDNYNLTGIGRLDKLYCDRLPSNIKDSKLKELYYYNRTYSFDKSINIDNMKKIFILNVEYISIIKDVINNNENLNIIHYTGCESIKIKNYIMFRISTNSYFYIKNSYYYNLIFNDKKLNYIIGEVFPTLYEIIDNIKIVKKDFSEYKTKSITSNK